MIFNIDPVHGRRYDETVRAIREHETLWAVNPRGGTVEPCSVPGVRGIGRTLPRGVCTFFHLCEAGRSPAGCSRPSTCAHPRHVNADVPPPGMKIVSATWKFVLESQARLQTAQGSGHHPQPPQAGDFAQAGSGNMPDSQVLAALRRLETRTGEADRARAPGGEAPPPGSGRKGRRGRSREARTQGAQGSDLVRSRPRRDEPSAATGKGAHSSGQQGTANWTEWPDRRRDERGDRGGGDRGGERRDRDYRGGGGGSWGTAGKGGRADGQKGGGWAAQGHRRYQTAKNEPVQGAEPVCTVRRMRISHFACDIFGVFLCQGCSGRKSPV